MDSTKVTPKTYTERFKEMEDQIMILTRQYFEASQAFEVSARIIQDLSIQIRMLNDQLQAMYDVGVVSRDLVATKINERRALKVREIIESDEKSGLISKVNVAQSENDIVVYSSEESILAFKSVGNFQEEGLDKELTGKKVGDTLKYKNTEGIEQTLKIEGIYTINQQQSGS